VGGFCFGAGGVGARAGVVGHYYFSFGEGSRVLAIVIWAVGECGR